MLDHEFVNTPELGWSETVRILNAYRSEPDLRRGPTLAHMHVRWLDAVARVEGEPEAIDAKQRGHPRTLRLRHAP